MEQATDIFSYIKSEENNYILPIILEDNWEFSLKEHVKTSFFYKNGRLLNGNDENTPVKNIVLSLRNLQDWAEDIDVKNVDIYADDGNMGLSFIIKKYHDDVFTVKNDIDAFIDKAKETKNDYGGVLAKKVKGVCPEVVPWQSIAFCDQTDIISGPIGIKHQYSPDQLKEMEKYGWGNEKNGATATIDDVIVLSSNYKQKDQVSTKTKTPGKYIEVYEVHGTFQEGWVKDGGQENKYSNQLHVVCYYTDETGKQRGITLFKGEEKESPFKYFSRDEIFGRAVGRGAIEELFEDQVWTTYSMIRKKDMLDAASKVILLTDDPTLAAKHPTGLKDLDNLELLQIDEGKTARPLDNTPRSMGLFDNFDAGLREHSKETSGATDALLGMNPQSGTPFRLQNLVANQGMGLHDSRRKKFARWIGEIYEDWLLPQMLSELTKGAKFLSSLSNEELAFVLDRMSTKSANKKMVELIIKGEELPEYSEIKQTFKEVWKLKGNKLPIELKDEVNDVAFKVKVNVANSKKDQAVMVDKLSNVLARIIANPQGFVESMKIPAVASTFSKTIEYSGLSSPDYAGLTEYEPPVAQTTQQNQPEAQPTATRELSTLIS